MSRSALLGLAMAAAIAAAVPAKANFVIGAPADPGTGNCFPFGCAGWGPTFQQVYGAAGFAGPVSISRLTFYNTQFLNGGTVATGNYTLSLSTTTAAVNGLSGNFALNRGADVTQVFDGSLPSLANGRLDIVLSSAFLYDPGQGNLLLEVFSPNAFTPNLLFLDARNGSAGGLFSRVYSTSGGSFQSNYGLVTGFNVPGTGTVPEPASWALLIGGFGLTGAMLRRRRLMVA